MSFGIGGIEEQSYTEKRPEVFFDPDGGVPEEATLELVRPKRFLRELSDPEFEKLIQREVQKREKSFREKANEP